jgi:hypothetical protein
VTEFIAEQVLVILLVGRQTESSKRPIVCRYQVPDPALDQRNNEVVMEGPAGLVAARHRVADQTHLVVHDHRENGERVTGAATREKHRHLGLSEQHGQRPHKGRQIVTGHRSSPSAHDHCCGFQRLVGPADTLASNPNSGGTSQVGPYRSATPTVEVGRFDLGNH